MLIDPVEVALNNLHQALCEQADYCQDSAAVLEGDAPSSALLRALALEHRQMADSLKPHIRRIALPKAANPEKELVQKIVTRAKAAFSSNDRAPVLEECRKTETELGGRVAEALRANVPAETRPLLLQFADRVAAAERQLARVSA